MEIDWLGLYQSGGVWAIFAVAAAVGLLIWVARYDRKQPHHPEVDAVAATLDKIVGKLDAVASDVTDLRARFETSTSDHQRQIDRLHQDRKNER